MPAAPRQTRDWLDPLVELDATGALAVERFLTFQVNQLSTDFERQWTRCIRDEAGVNLSQWRILAILRGGPATFARLAETTGINKALVSRSIHELEALGHLAIQATPADARSITLSLTPRGQKLMRGLMPLALRRQRHLLAALTAGERRAFEAAVVKLRRAAAEWDDRASLESPPA